MTDHLFGLGARPSSKDSRDFTLDRFVVAAPPPKYSPPHAWTVLDQGQTPKCVGFSGAGNSQVRTEIDVADWAVFDGPDLYAYCKANDGQPGQEGTDIRTALGVLLRTGAKVDAALAGPLKPGQREKITAYAGLNSLADVKLAIATYGSAWVASDWPESWFDPRWMPGSSCFLPLPDAPAGGHAYMYIGYDDTLACPDGTHGALLVQNSWGTDWASGGRVWLPYSYFNPGNWEAWRTIPAPLEADPMAFSPAAPTATCDVTAGGSAYAFCSTSAPHVGPNPYPAAPKIPLLGYQSRADGVKGAWVVLPQGVAWVGANHVTNVVAA